jgi:GDP-L-fucose synthase
MCPTDITGNAALKPVERIFVAGHNGMVGSAIVRRLCARGAGVITRTRAELDLTDQAAVHAFFDRERPDGVIIAAARVGGILANITYPSDFIHENLMIAANVIHAARANDVARLLHIASASVFPRDAPQPLREDMLLAGPLDPTHEPYALAKIAGIKLCEASNRQYGTDFRSIVPTNLYGPGDNFDPAASHVVPAMIRRFHEAVRDGRDEVVIWGTGTPRRELLHVDDLADAALFVFQQSPEHFRDHAGAGFVNVGVGHDVSIRELAAMIAAASGFDGRISTDPSKPDGAMRRLLDVSRLAAMGWRAGIELVAGLGETCAWYRSYCHQLRRD